MEAWWKRISRPSHIRQEAVLILYPLYWSLKQVRLLQWNSRDLLLLAPVLPSTNETSTLQRMTNGLRYLFSRKERQRRKQAQQSIPQVPPVYRSDSYDTPPNAVPRSAHPRPLSSFAPDYSRQCQNGHQYAQQRPRASLDHPPRYPALPAYDPSKYQPIRSTSTYGADQLSSYTDYNQSHHRAQSSRLSAVHYIEARSSIYQPQPPPRPGQYSVSMMPREYVAPHARRQSAMSTRHTGSVGRRSSQFGEGRERSVSEPMPATAQSARGPKRAKPVLSRLITNFD